MVIPADLGKGFYVDVVIGKEHLRLFSETQANGYVAIVCHLSAKHEVTRKQVRSLDEGKNVAEDIAERYLAEINLNLPVVQWTSIADQTAR
jgi:hypothetical protein